MFRMLPILICSAFSLVAFAGPHTTTSFIDSGSKSVSEKRIHRLLERSLRLELEAIAGGQVQPNPNLSGSYTKQIGLRRLAGEDQQVAQLLDAIANWRPKPAGLATQDQAFPRLNPAQTPAVESQWPPQVLTTVIDRGDLDLAWKQLQADAPTLVANDQRNSRASNPEQVHQRNMDVANHIWLTCKLAAAYSRSANPDRVRKCLNHVRKVQEGVDFNGKEFDADGDWLPPSPTEFRYGTNVQTRLTFYWTLIQTGYPEVAIDWYLADAVLQPEKKVVFGYGGFQNDAHAEFVNNVARFVSPERASQFANQLYLGLVPRKIHMAVAMGSLEVGNFQIAKKHIKRLIELLPEDKEVTDYSFVTVVDKLAETNQTKLASELVGKLVERIEVFEAKLLQQSKNGQMPEILPFYNHGTYAQLARKVVRFDRDLALKLLELHQKSPQKRPYDQWVIAECVRAYCGKITPEKHFELTNSCFADDLIEAYIESGQLELAKNTVLAASLHTRKNTTSGNWIGGSSKGLGLLNYNAYERILLARRAVFFKDFELARKLLDEMKHGDSQREGYRAVTKMIAETWGKNRAEQWIDETHGRLSQSGAILGLVDFLVPTPVSRDNIPSALFGGC